MANKSDLSVGYTRLPGRVREGSKADYAKEATKDARASMASVTNKFKDFIEQVKKAAPSALHAAILPTFEKSQTYCPKKTHALVNSGNLEVGQQAGRAYARISYGAGGQIHYAAIVHERTDLHHVSPTRSKFLQAAVEEDIRELPQRFAAAIKGGQ